MTKKHFKAVANIIARATIVQERTKLDKDYVVEQLGNYFANNNPRFDRNKFYTACEYKG